MKYSEEMADKVVHLYDKGKSLDYIAEVIQRDKSIVKRLLLSRGVEIRKRGGITTNFKSTVIHSWKLSPMEVLALCGYGSGLSANEIAFRMGYTSHQSVRLLLKSAFKKIQAREQADKGGQI